MKKTHLFLLTIIAFNFYSCPSSDDDFPEANATIEGTWQIESVFLENAYDFNMDGTASNDLIAESDCLQDETYVFNMDGTGTYNSMESLDISSMIDVSTNQIFYDVDCDDSEPFTDPITWSENNNTITIIQFGETLTGTISGNTATFVLDEGFSIDMIQGGQINTVYEQITVVLSKIQ